MGTTLKDMRREAGYRSAREFAEAAGIPAPTYSRYESVPERIPLERAWAIADFLGTSIDAVVGRKAAPVRGEVQARYDALSDESKQIVSDQLDFLEARDAKRATAKRDAERARYRGLALRYEAAYLADMCADPDDPDDLGTPAERRGAVESFIADRKGSRRDVEVEEMRAQLEQANVIDAELVADLDDEFRTEGESATRLPEAEVDRVVENYEFELMDRDGKEVRRIMAAYDEFYGIAAE